MKKIKNPAGAKLIVLDINYLIIVKNIINQINKIKKVLQKNWQHNKKEYNAYVI